MTFHNIIHEFCKLIVYNKQNILQRIKLITNILFSYSYRNLSHDGDVVYSKLWKKWKPSKPYLPTPFFTIEIP